MASQQAVTDQALGRTQAEIKQQQDALLAAVKQALFDQGSQVDISRAENFQLKEIVQKQGEAISHLRALVQGFHHQGEQTRQELRQELSANQSRVEAELGEVAKLCNKPSLPLTCCIAWPRYPSN